MIKLNCPCCEVEVEKTLVVLPSTHKEYFRVCLTDDGTRKWFLCENCEGVFCYDKMQGIWQYSPDTYVNFLQDGLIDDQLID